MQSPPQLETPRLTLRPLSLEDVDPLFVICSDAETMRYWDTPTHKSIEDTRQMLWRAVSLEGACYWTIVFKEEVIGYVGFIGRTRIPGMSYLVRRDLWGQGIAPEAVRAVLADGFERQGMKQIELWINEENSASLRVAEKLGFSPKGYLLNRHSWESTHHTMRVYGLWADEWRNGQPQRPSATYRVEPVLAVHDVRKSAEFYRNKLGFHIDLIYGDPPDHAIVTRGDWSSASVTIQMSMVSTPLNPSGWLYILTDSAIDTLYEQYRTNGVTIIAEPKTYPWGMREFAIRDCNGYQLRFGTQHPS